MQVVHPARYQPAKQHIGWWPYVAVPIVGLLIAGGINYLRPLPTNTITLHLTPPATSTTELAWPATGEEAAVAATGYGILGTNGTQAPTATASIAKVITALCVLQKQPLALGQTGPTYAVDATDVSIYQNYVTEDGSLVPVQVGEHITEYQALQALMIPSANNIADSLVRWVFGSQAAYNTYATTFLQQNNINTTHIGIDASGYDASTTSTASDLTEIGLLALQNQTLMQIVGQKTANLPVIGTVNNYDSILGQNGINGIKTGNNTTDLGAFLFSADKQIGTQTIHLTGTIMDAPNLTTALDESVQLAASLGHGFEQAQVLRAGDSIGSVQTAWGGEAHIEAAQNVQLVRWKETPVTETPSINKKRLYGSVGTLRAIAGHNSANTALRLDHTIPGPSFIWRLTRH